MRLGHSGAGGFDQLFELAASQISKHHAGRAQGILRELRFHFGIYTAGHEEEIGITIIVQVDDATSPTHKACFYTQSTADGEVVEGAIAVVAIENAGVVGEVRFENIQVPVEIEIS